MRVSATPEANRQIADLTGFDIDLHLELIAVLGSLTSYPAVVGTVTAGDDGIMRLVSGEWRGMFRVDQNELTVTTVRYRP